MTNPQNIVDFTGIGRFTVTYLIDNSTITYNDQEENGSAQVGLAVTLSAANTVALTGDGEFVLGKLILVESDLKATVQVGGYMTLPSGAGATLTRGKSIVGDLDTAAKGYIREVATATAAELGVARGFIQDGTTASAVLVFL
jgi:hypothetical protein